MHNQPYVGRIALCTRKKLLKSGEIRHFYGMGLIRVWSQISETLIKFVKPRIWEICLEWIQYPHRRRCNGWGCGHDETRPSYPL